jgi:hypothetical protein
MTLEEMEAHSAYLHAHLKKLHDDMLAEATEKLAKTKNPVDRELLIAHIEGVRAIGNGKYD